jgi:glycosyltransferase involved in cell wall biosynthesis
MRLGIDASNIRSGGGVTHLVEMLGVATPDEQGFSQVIVWAGKQTLAKLPCEPWLKPIHDPMLDQTLPARLFWQKVRLPQFAKTECDILFCPGGGNGGGFKPYVTMSQNMLPFEPYEKSRYGFSWIALRLTLLHFIQSRSFVYANGLIFLTEYARSVIFKQINQKTEPVTVIPHGINSNFFQKPRTQKEVSSFTLEDPFHFLYVSIIDIYKHQWHVCEAIALLRKQGYPVVLDLIGHAYPPALQRLQKTLHKLDSEQQFLFYQGSVDYDQLNTYYHKANGFIFASSCENLPIILLEAMASGLPIACSDRGPMPEILGDAGLYFDPEKPTSIAKALTEIINEPALREKISWKAFEKAQSYSWQRCANRTFAFLKQVADSYSEPK